MTDSKKRGNSGDSKRNVRSGTDSKRRNKTKEGSEWSNKPGGDPKLHGKAGADPKKRAKPYAGPKRKPKVDSRAASGSKSNGQPVTRDYSDVDNSRTDKIQKILANAGLGSRRDMEKALSEGRIRMNGDIAKLGDRAGPADELAVDGRVVKREHREVRRVLVYNKPEGEICSVKDPEGRPTVFQKLPKLVGERWINVGRLDINTSGLLMFTNDGELANKLMHPSSEISREYAVRILGEVNVDMINRMHEGVELEDGMARFTDIQEFGGKGANVWYHVVVMEGRNREVRRLWESQGVQVSRLKRVRYGKVFMEPELRAGTWREMDRKEVDLLAKSVELPPKAWTSLFTKDAAGERLKKKASKQRTRRHA